MHVARVMSRAVWSVAATVLVSCGGGGDGGTPVTPDPKPTPAFSLSVGAAPTIQQSGSGSVAITLARSGGFTGAVDLTLEGAPSGVTGTLTPASVASGATSSSLALAVSLNVPAGTYPLVVRGRGTGVSDQTAAVTLTVVTRPASIALSRANNNVLTTSAGGLALNADIVINRIEYLGAVTLAVQSGLPAGVTATFAPNGTTNNLITATFTASSATAPGSYNIVLQGTGTGVTAATVTVPITVTGAASVALSVSRPIVSIAQNGSGVNSLVITRTNFPTAVTIAVDGLPNGASVALGTNPTAGNGGTITFTVGPTVTPGSYTVTISASAPGIATASTSFTLIVTSSSAGGNTTYRFCGSASEIPIWFAYTSANAYTRVTNVNNTFSFDVFSATTVVWVTQNGADDYRMTIFAGNADEIAQHSISQCLPSRSATGTVVGFGATDFIGLSFGGRSPATSITIASPNFTVTGLPDGALDLVATRSSLSGASLTLDKILLQRGLTTASGGSVGNVDFNGANAFAPVTKTVTVVNGNGEPLSASAFFSSAGRASASLGTANIASGTSTSYSHVPVARLQSGDMHTITASAQNLTGQTPNFVRSVSRVLATPADVSLTLGAAPSVPNVAVFSNPGYLRMIAVIPVQSDYQSVWGATFSQTNGGTHREVSYTATVGAIQVSPQSTLRIADFTAVPGWQNTWGLQSGIPVNWGVTAGGWSGTGGGVNGPTVDGTTILSYVRFGILPP